MILDFSSGRYSPESDAWAGHCLHFRAHRCPRPRSRNRLRAWNLRGQYLPHLRRSSWPVRNTSQFGNCIRLYQTAWRRVPDFSWGENDHRPLKAIWPAAAFSAVHERCGVSTGCSDKHAESESGVVLSRVPSPVYRPGFDYESAGVSEPGPHVCDHWHSLVPGSGVVCLSFQQTNTHKPNNWTMGQWNRRCALHFYRHPARNRKTMMRTQCLMIPTARDFLHLTGY